MKKIFFLIILIIFYSNLAFAEKIELICECVEFHRGYDGSVEEVKDCRSQNTAFIIDLKTNIGKCTNCRYTDETEYIVDEYQVKRYFSRKAISEEDAWWDYKFILDRRTGNLYESDLDKKYGFHQKPYFRMWNRICKKGSKLF